MITQHFLNPADFSQEQLNYLIDLGLKIKQKKFKPDLTGKKMALLFFAPSVRTKLSFEAAMIDMGGQAIDFSSTLGSRTFEYKENIVMHAQPGEHIKDLVNIIAHYANCLGVRIFPHLKNYLIDSQDEVISAFAKYSPIPVINMESSLYHPCQSLADAMTIKEKLGDFKNKKIVLSWVYAPKAPLFAVPNSFAITLAKLGANLTILSPKEFQLPSDQINKIKKIAKENNGEITITNNLNQGYQNTKIIYAKSWPAFDLYGNWEKEIFLRKQYRQNWIVDQPKMKLTKKAYVMHCMPFRRNVEITDEVADSSNSLIYDQAENRLHIQKAILYKLLNNI